MTHVTCSSGTLRSVIEYGLPFLPPRLLFGEQMSKPFVLQCHHVYGVHRVREVRRADIQTDADAVRSLLAHLPGNVAACARFSRRVDSLLMLLPVQ